jgi:hypothetical protein
MNIYFDFEKEEYKNQYIVPDSAATSQTILKEIKDFITQRLFVLSDEIKIYPDGYTVFYIIGDSEVPFEHIGFPELLTDKMYNCITKTDFDYILGKVWEIIYPGLLPPSS